MHVYSSCNVKQCCSVYCIGARNKTAPLRASASDSVMEMAYRDLSRGEPRKKNASP